MKFRPNNIEGSEEYAAQKLIRNQIRRVTVFGPSSKPDEASEELLKKMGNKISDLGLTLIMGADKGALETISSGIMEKAGKVIVTKSTAGKEKGFTTKNVRGHLRGVYYKEGHSGKHIGLYERSGAYIVLPGSSLGTYAELVDALDKVTNFDNYLGEAPIPVIFIGDFWKKHYDEFLEPMIKSKKQTEHIYFIKEEAEIEPILLKYAKIKKEHNRKDRE